MMLGYSKSDLNEAVSLKAYDEIAAYGFDGPIMEDVADFLFAVEHQDETNICEIKHRYETVYTDLKGEWVRGKISEDDFWRLTALVQEGL